MLYLKGAKGHRSIDSVQDVDTIHFVTRRQRGDELSLFQVATALLKLLQQNNEQGEIFITFTFTMTRRISHTNVFIFLLSQRLL